MSWGEWALLGGFTLFLLLIGVVLGVVIMRRTREYRSGEQVLEAIAEIEADQELAAQTERRMHEVAQNYWGQA